MHRNRTLPEEGKLALMPYWTTDIEVRAQWRGTLRVGMNTEGLAGRSLRPTDLDELLSVIGYNVPIVTLERER